MKKGFTLIEIIISLVLVSLIGVGSTIIVINSKKDELKDINKKILEAANVYINVEKDENGITYFDGIQKGAKGVQITVKNLLDKGYVDKSVVKTLEDNTNKTSDKLYLLAAIFSEDDAHCGVGSIEIKNSWTWTNITEPTYLCGYSTKKEDIFNLSTSCPTDKINDINYGKLCYDSTYDKYYFRHRVKNNYVKFGKNISTNEDLLWRIINIKDEKVKLTLNDRLTVNGTLFSKSSYFTSNQWICFGNYNSKLCGNYKTQIKLNSVSNDQLYFTLNAVDGNSSYNVSFLWDDSNDIIFYKDYLSNDMLMKNPIYSWIYNPLKDWWDITNLNSLDVLESKWCVFGTEDSCQDNAYILSKFGLLYSSDYSYAGTRLSRYGDDIDYSLFNLSIGNFTQIKEIVFDFIPVPTVAYYDSMASNYNEVYLRPTIYVDLSRLKHAESLENEGTESNPYIIE